MVVIIAAVVWLSELNNLRKAPRYYDADAPFTAPDRSEGAQTWNQRFLSSSRSHLVFGQKLVQGGGVGHP